MKLLAAALGILFFAQNVLGEVSLKYSPTVLFVNEPTDVAVSLRSNEGFSVNIWALGIEYNYLPYDLVALNATYFKFVSPFSNNENWAIDVIGFPGFAFALWFHGSPGGVQLSSGEAVQFATITLEPIEIGLLQLFAKLEVTDDQPGGDLPHAIVENGDPTTFLVLKPGDGDFDNDVDLDDFGLFQSCMLGPDNIVGLQCYPFDFDRDQDVDLSNFGRMQTLIPQQNP